MKRLSIVLLLTLAIQMLFLAPASASTDDYIMSSYYTRIYNGDKVVGFIEPNKVYHVYSYTTDGKWANVGPGYVYVAYCYTFNSFAAADAHLMVSQGLRRMHKDYAFTALGATGFGSDNVRIGASEEDLIRTLGQPKEINRTVTESSVSEQYVYGNGRYVYVENGRVTAWQDRR